MTTGILSLAVAALAITLFAVARKPRKPIYTDGTVAEGFEDVVMAFRWEIDFHFKAVLRLRSLVL